jgi:ABC-type multidrug transport system ATPase subunit
VGFPLPGVIRGGPPDDETVANMTCYKGGETVFNNHQMCDITNRKILDMLPNRPPQVTFSCDNTTSTCSFEFWTAQQESFYCGLDSCKSDRKTGYDANTTEYACNKIQCKCIPGRFLCGEAGSVDISDFLVQEIRGPAKFSCKSGQGCRFEEPSMNKLINDIFGDAFIALKCEGGECLHYSQVPGYHRPAKPNNTKWIALSTAGAGLIVIVTVIGLWYVGRPHPTSPKTGPIALPSDPRHPPSHPEHVPATVHFSSLSYTLPNGLEVLKDVRGIARPGKLTAVMGASGSGKSSLLDILAHRSKIGSVNGSVLVNGRPATSSQVRWISGYVDQEDTLMETLTVYETVLYSALLRLPREMSEDEKIARVYGTLEELGIRGIMNRRIGGSGKRSISGGEKRRVSIACELVTSPSILFLDEPTSGLDSYNAQSVIESLSNLARTYNRTVILTIHQPRSGIVALFDEFIMLAKGRCVWAGPMRSIAAPQLIDGGDEDTGNEVQGVGDWLESIGRGCPTGFNLADYLIDLTVNAGNGFDELGSPSLDPSSDATRLPSSSFSGADEERALLSRTADETELQTRIPSASSRRMSISSTIKQKTSQLFDAVRNGRNGSANREVPPRLAELVTTYENSSTARYIQAEFEAVRAANSPGFSSSATSGEVSAPSNGTIDEIGERVGMIEMRDVVGETGMLRGRRSASWPTQFRILSGRAFKNLYRDPALLMAHYFGSIVLALICGLFFHNVGNDIAGFQNRLGIFFFTLALFGFSCLSSLALFANERILFMRERANGYYSTFTYFSSKVLFDILPLRLVPPLLFGGIVYGLVGLVATVPAFWKFILTLVLFNLTTASVILLLSIAFESTGMASLVGTLVMLFNLLFTGLLINRETVTPALRWLHTISFFHAAFEALAVNELRYLQLKEIRYGIELDVPAATILSVFGLRAQSFWWPNIGLLGIFTVTFTVASFLTLHLYVKEKR